MAYTQQAKDLTRAHLKMDGPHMVFTTLVSTSGRRTISISYKCAINHGRDHLATFVEDYLHNVYLSRPVYTCHALDNEMVSGDFISGFDTCTEGPELGFMRKIKCP